MGAKIGKENKYKIDNCNLIIGTVNKNECKSIYVQLNGYIKPQFSILTSIEAIRRKIIANRYQVSKKYFDGLKSSLFALEYNKSKSVDIAGKKSYISIEFTLFYDFDWKVDSVAAYQFGKEFYELFKTMEEHFEIQ
jgi:hypothetical protein